MSKKKTHEEFVQEIEQLYPHRYTFLTEYIGNRELITVKRNNCGHILNTYPSNIYRDSDCSECIKIKNKNLFLNNFNRLFGDNFEIVNLNEYINAYTKIQIRHKICGTIFPIIPRSVLQSKVIKCPRCDNSTKLVPYINDIYSTDKEMYKLLKDKNDAFRYFPNSKYSTWFICPFCKKEFYRIIKNVHQHGLCCDRCDDNISYPEKYMGELLSQLNISYIRQFNEQWAGLYRYDFYFSINEEKYLIEMDGGFHFNQYQKGKNTLENVQLSDENKTFLAQKNGFHLIRINCNYPSMHERGNYLEKKIKESFLNIILDLSHVDFQKCNEVAQSSFIVLISEKWNQGIKEYSELSKLFSISEATIRNYIRTASSLGLIAENYNEIRIKNKKSVGKKLGFPVKCNETNEIFSSFKEADRKHNCNVSMYFSKSLKYSGTLKDGTKLTWTKL